MHKHGARQTRVAARVCGFTLIELLVVIAIISLLVSILLPSLRRATDLARRTICSSNLHNGAMATHMYVGENDGRVPPNQRGGLSRHPWPYATDAALSPAGEFIDGNGHVLLLPYLGAEEEMKAGPGVAQDAEVPIRGTWDIFRCPGISGGISLWRNYHTGGSRYTISTHYNQFCGYEFAPTNTEWIPGSSHHLEELDSRFPLYTDFVFSWPTAPWVVYSWTHSWSGDFAGSNTSRADGSVEWLSPGNDPSESFDPTPAHSAQNRCYWMPTSL